MNIRSQQNAGLGSAGSVGHSLDVSSSKLQQANRWSRAQERYDRLEAADLQAQTGGVGGAGGQAQGSQSQKKPAVTRMTFVKKSTMHLDQNEET